MTTDPSGNPLAGNSIDAEITQILKAQISGYHVTRLKGNKRSHAQASASIIFGLFSEPHQIRETSPFAGHTERAVEQESGGGAAAQPRRRDRAVAGRGGGGTGRRRSGAGPATTPD